MTFWDWAGEHPFLFVIGGLGTIWFVETLRDGIIAGIAAWRSGGQRK